MHKLLRRQIQRHFGNPDDLRPELRALLDAVSEAYTASDDDRVLLERSMDLASDELFQTNNRLRAELAQGLSKETLLREKTSELQGILEAFPDSYARVSKDGKFTAFTRPTGREFVVGPEDIVGRHLREVLPLEAAVRWEEAMLSARATATPTMVEFSLRSLSKEQHREVTIIPFLRDEFIAIIRSTTKRKEMEARLHLADRMASVGTLAAGVAHEINNPLSFMLSNLAWIGEALDELLGDRRSDPEVLAVYEAIKETEDGAHRVRIIARDLKTFSRADEAGIGPVDIHAVLESTINMAANEVRHRGTLVREYGDIRPAQGNHGRLGQVFLNLLMNAAQSIKEGDALGNVICVRTYMDGPARVVIEVRDTGSGIPEELLGRIFDPFFTTKGVGAGTGLGLSICHGIVSSFHGDLMVESEPGRGSVFRVVLPASTMEVRVPPSAPKVEAVVRRGRLLIVDDDVMVAASLRRRLEKDHDVVVAMHAREALARILQGERFDVIFCDLMMPDMTGMDLHAAITEKVPAQAERMVFITGGAFTVGAHDFLERVKNARLGKPLEMANIRAILAHHLS